MENLTGKCQGFVCKKILKRLKLIIFVITATQTVSVASSFKIFSFVNQTINMTMVHCYCPKGQTPIKGIIMVRCHLIIESITRQA